MNIADLIQQGAANVWLLIPSAILLGALHGLEPGHSKTMMAAFIIAVRGTIFQAVLLGLAATVSHTLIVWIIALLGLHFGSHFNTEATEPYLQVISGGLIIAIAYWMAWRTWAERHRHDHHHEHGGHHHNHGDDHDHSHDHHRHRDEGVLGTAEDKFSDAHERAHAEDIRRRFRNRTVTTGQIVMFGLTGGLVPCPASITVLLICLQLKQFALGALMVLCFSIGLAVTMVSVGAAAALSVNQISKRWAGFEEVASRAPYLSAGLMVVVGLYTGLIGWHALA